VYLFKLKEVDDLKVVNVVIKIVKIVNVVVIVVVGHLVLKIIVEMIISL
jgi:hypothetical protein